MLSSLSRPFHGFSVEYSAYASIWLVFMVPMLWAYSDSHPEQNLWIVIALVGLFVAIYSFAFGAVRYYPRDMSDRGRFWLYFVLLGGAAGASAIYLGNGVIIFVPYLCAYVVYLYASKMSILAVVGIGATAFTLTMIFNPEQWIGALITTILTPAFITSLAMINQWSDSKQALKENLRITHEREAIAVDVHDLLGHSLTVINLKAELARRLIDSDPTRAQAEVEHIAALSRTSLAEVRSTVTRMRSPNFAGEVAAARRALETVGITPDLPDNVDVVGTNHTLFAWVLRELVTNVVRHSQASHCQVRVSSQKLQVVDDGIGFDAPAHPSTGGLSGLQQRVDDAGGRVVYLGNSTVLVTMNGNEDPL